MKVHRPALALGYSFAIAFLSASLGSIAECQPNTTGEIEIDQTQDLTPYVAAQRSAIAYFKDLEGVVATLASGASASPPEINEKALLHVAGVYLYCTLKAGTCPIVLQSILEIDLINSRKNKHNSCPTMLAFWKLWKKQGLETRAKSGMKTGHMLAVSEFDRTERPKYLRCAEALSALNKGPASDAEFFAQRYKLGSPERGYFSKLVKLLEKIKEQTNNVFAAS